MSTTSVTTKKTTTSEPHPGGRAQHYPFTESFVRGSDGTRLYVRERPGPEPLTALLCDGLVCDGFIYKYLWDDLAKLATVVHWHYRGHGRSAPPVDERKIGIVDHAADLDAVRQHTGDPQVVLVGHSMGTQVLLEAFRRRRENVAGLVMLCGSFGRVTHTFKNSDLLATVLPRLLEVVVEHPRIARALWSRVPANIAVRIAYLIGDIDPRTVMPEDVEPYFNHAAHVDFEMFLRMLRDAGEHTAEDMLAEVDVPVLVVAGEVDSFTPPDLSRAMADQLPRGELLMLPGGTHVAPLEHREALALALAKFFARLT